MQIALASKQPAPKTSSLQSVQTATEVLFRLHGIRYANSCLQNRRPHAKQYCRPEAGLEWLFGWRKELGVLCRNPLLWETVGESMQKRRESAWMGTAKMRARSEKRYRKTERVQKGGKPKDKMTEGTTERTRERRKEI